MGEGLDPKIAALVEALNAMGACTVSSCEGHIERLADGTPCLPCVPFVVFRSSPQLADEILWIIRRLYFDPHADEFLGSWWIIESAPSPEGGILRTLTLHPSHLADGLDATCLAAVQRDAETLANALGVHRYALVV